jgi:hypothetical protein
MVTKTKKRKGPFKVEHSIEITSANGLFTRLKNLIINPFTYLFTGKIKY